MNLKTDNVSVRHVVHFDEQKKADNRRTVLDSSNEQDQYNQPLLDRTVLVPSRPESNREQEDDIQDGSSTQKKEDVGGVVDKAALEETPM